VSPTPLISTKRILYAIDSFGANRIVLGSDTPFGRENLGKNICKIRQLDISETEKELILGLNLQKLLRLK